MTCYWRIWGITFKALKMMLFLSCSAKRACYSLRHSASQKHRKETFLQQFICFLHALESRRTKNPETITVKFLIVPFAAWCWSHALVSRAAFDKNRLLSCKTQSIITHVIFYSLNNENFDMMIPTWSLCYFFSLKVCPPVDSICTAFAIRILSNL